MGLTLITGGSGAGKTHLLFENIIQQSMQEPGRRFLVIVPEQATMQAERALVRLHPRHGIMNIDVLSFNRLAYRVFAELGRDPGELLGEVGKTFLLEKIALEKKKELPYYGEMLTKPAHLLEMKSAISELMLYDVSPDDLRGAVLSEERRRGTSFAMKMDDTAAVYQAFLKRLKGAYFTAEELPDRLAEVIEKSGMVRGATVALDGFTGFTPVQLRLIGKLLPCAKEVYVTLTMDPDENEFHSAAKSDLFALSRETAGKLAYLANDAGVPLRDTIRVRASAGSRHAASPQLRVLEKNLFRAGHRAGHAGNAGDAAGRYRAAGADTEKAEPDGPAGSETAAGSSIRIFRAENPARETEEAALTICRWVREDGLRYRDIAVIAGSPDTYGTHVRRVFSKWEIPYFVDETRSILRNPCIEYLRAALEAVSDDYSYESIFRLLKSGMTDFTADETEHLENYVLGRGIRGKKRWREPFLRGYPDEDMGEIPLLEKLRVRLLALLDPLADAFARRGGTVRAKTEALYDFCVRSRLEERMNDFAAALSGTGGTEGTAPDLALAREYAQVYPYIMDFLDKLVRVLGDEKISMKDYRALIEAGFAEAKVAVIPAGSDQVVIGDMERTRIADAKALIFLGVNDGIVPRTAAAGGAFSEADRKKLGARKIRLKATAREAIYIQRLYIYLVLTEPSEKLCLMYSKNAGNGEALRPSYIIDSVKRLFPGMEETAEDPDPCARFERPEAGFSLLAEGLAGMEERPLSPAFLQLFSWYRSEPRYERRTVSLLQAAGKFCPAGQIGRAAAAALYGRNIQGSASRLERFFSCEFAHFLQYGLRLKERPDHEFRPLDRGLILHRALELYVRKTRDSGDGWQDIAEDEALRRGLYEEGLRQAVGESGVAENYDSARTQFEVERIRRLMDHTAWAAARELAAGDFQPFAEEIDFSKMESLDALRFALPEGGTMSLTGRIDRVDTCADGERTLVAVTDYKTGRKAFSLTEVLSGQQLQLVMYMNAVLEMLEREGKTAVPAGMFYYLVNTPLITVKPGETKDIDAEILKELRPSGVVLAERDVLRHFDRELESTGASVVVKVRFKKDGTFYKDSKVLTLEAFRTVCVYVRHKILAAGEKILAGDAKINPAKNMKTGESACDFCPFSGICGIDPKIPGYRYRGIRNLADQEATERMEDELEREKE